MQAHVQYRTALYLVGGLKPESWAWARVGTYRTVEALRLSCTQPPLVPEMAQ
jgi:hypothetical protein